MIVDIDPVDKQVKLYDLKHVPLIETGMKNFPQANYLAGDYGAPQRLEKVKNAMSKLQLGISLGHFVTFKLSKKK